MYTNYLSKDKLTSALLSANINTDKMQLIAITP